MFLVNTSKEDRLNISGDLKGDIRRWHEKWQNSINGGRRIKLV
jgi:hypothetical protein